MCGIFAYISSNNKQSLTFIKKQFDNGSHRGPESSNFITVGNNFHFGFHRLAINGLNKESDQPFYIDGIYLICNGEIYNYRKLYEILPRQMFATKVQAKALGRIISSKTLSALRKDVTQHMYGGDITRKMKLREKQKKGKKKMLERGKVNIGQDVFLKMMKND